MADNEEHRPTEQEDAIYDALTAGDQEAIDQLRDTAYGIDEQAPTDPGTPGVPTTPEPEPEPLAPPEQFEEDYEHAYARYQADHEAPEEDREEAAREAVKQENAAAQKGAPG